MKKLFSSASAVSISDWLKMKPYSTFKNAYDPHYLKLCNEVLRWLNHEKDWFNKLDVSTEQRIELSCILVSYYEDYINDIGIWRAYTSYNEELYGYPMPFYKLDQYQTDYVNVEDIAFLIWHYITKYTEREYIVEPDHENLMDLAESIFDLFDEDVEDAPNTNTYDKFFTVSDSMDFFDFKTTIAWFATHSYLIGIEFGKIQARQLAELRKELRGREKEYPPDIVGKLLYSQMDKFYFTKRSSFSALTAAEWMARFVKCSDKKRAEIANLTYWIDGNFHYEGETKKHASFCHIQTKEVFHIVKHSFQNGKIPKMTIKNTVGSFHAVIWKGEYHLSGAFAAGDVAEKDLLKLKNKALDAPWMMPPDKLKMAIEVTEKMQDSFFDYFKSQMVIFDNQQQVMKAQADFMEYHNQKLKGKESFADRSKKFFEKTGKPSELDLSSLDKKSDVSLFFRKGGGVMIIPNVRTSIQQLTAQNLSEAQRVDLYISLANGFHPAVVTYLLDTYGSDNVKFPLEDANIDLLRDLPFFWRMNSPEEFDKEIPMMTMVDGFE